MALKKFRPLTPGQRFKLVSDNDDITHGKPEKSLLVPVKKSGGRDNTGKMTMRYIGGGHKQQYRIIDFKRDKSGIPATVKTIGNALYLSDIPLGTTIHNIELRPGQGAIMARSAGSAAQLSARDGKYAIIKMPSGETRMVLITCMATIGSVSNADHNLEISGKAGRTRWQGRRPRTRPVAMNPVDHPMGGGEGRASGGHPRSRTGTPSKGYKTRYPKKASNKYIIERRKK